MIYSNSLAQIVSKTTKDKLVAQIESRSNEYGDCDTLDQSIVKGLLEQVIEYQKNNWADVQFTPQFLTWMLLEPVRVCPIEKLIDRMKTLEDSKLTENIISQRFEDCVKFLARHIIIHRNPNETNPTFYMIGRDEFGQRRWIGKTSEQISKMLQPARVTRKNKDGSVRKFDLFKALQISDYRIIAHCTTVDYQRPIMFIDSDEGNDYVHFNMLVRRPYSNQQIQDIVHKYFEKEPEVIIQFLANTFRSLQNIGN